MFDDHYYSIFIVFFSAAKVTIATGLGEDHTWAINWTFYSAKHNYTIANWCEDGDKKWVC